MSRRLSWKPWWLAAVMTWSFALPAAAQLSDKNRGELEKMVPTTAYLRIDLPVVHGKQGMIASWVEPMVDVSPAGVTVRDNTGWSGSAWTGTKRALFKGFGPNDAFKFKELKFDDKDGSIDVVFEGLGPKKLKKNKDAAVRIVQARNAGEFKAALELAFSAAPLQDAHPDWPEEIRKAIAERRVIEGMTAEQVSCVAAKPGTTETLEENGSKAEIWQIAPEKRVLPGRAPVKDAFASKLKFVDGRLASITSQEPKD